MIMLMAPFHYLNDPVFLTFTYLWPVIPFIVQFDGLISMMRTRTAKEIYTLLQSQVLPEELSKWKFLHGEDQHTWGFGWLSWVICYKDED